LLDLLDEIGLTQRPYHADEQRHHQRGGGRARPGAVEDVVADGAGVEDDGPSVQVEECRGLPGGHPLGDDLQRARAGSDAP